MKTVFFLIIYTTLLGGDATIKVEMSTISECNRLLEAVYRYWPDPLHKVECISVKQSDI